MLGKQVGGCAEATVRVYRTWLGQLSAQVVGDISTLDGATVTRFFVRLRERGLSASSVHQAYRSLKTFCRWLVATVRPWPKPDGGRKHADAGHAAPGPHRR